MAAQRPSNDDRPSLESRIQQIEMSWKSRIAPDLMKVLSGVDFSEQRYVTAECVKVDMEYRWNQGTPVFIEEYLKQWPDILSNEATTIELLESECTSRTLFSDAPTEQELIERFPSIAARIDLQGLIDSALQDRADLEIELTSDVASRATDGDTDGRPVTQPPVILLGEQLGRYKIEGKIGGGGQGDVYRAVDTRIDRYVALKLLRHSDSRILERFVLEPQFAARVKHKNICPIYDAGIISGMHYIAMELVEGESIQQQIENDGPFDTEESAQIACDVARALSQVHAADIVHRDVKSGNIMLDSNGAPVLMDFGLARTASDTDTLTTTQSFAGTLAFMSPEQALGYVPDYRSDIYSLGAVLYHMLTGNVPFGALPAEFYKHIGKSQPPGPRKSRRDLHWDLDAICRKAMAVRPQDRYKSADEMADALQRYLQKRPQIVRPPGTMRRRLGWTAAFAALMVLAVGGTHLLWRDAERPKVAEIRWLDTSGPVHSYAIDEERERIFVAADELNKTYPIRELRLKSGSRVGDPIFFGDLHQHTGLAILRDPNRLLATNFYFDYVSHIDLDGSRKPESIRIISADKEMGDAWRWPSGIVLTPDQTKAIVPMGHDDRPEPPDGIINDQLAIVDLTQTPPMLLAEVPLDDEPWGYGLCIPPDENALYLTTKNQTLTDPFRAYRVELTPPYSVKTLEIPEGRIQDIEVSSEWDRVYVADTANRKVWTMARPRFGSSTPTRFYEYEGRAPCDLAIHEGRQLMAVVCSESRSLHIVDAIGGQELARIERLRTNCAHLEFSRDGSQIFLANAGLDGGIGIVDLPDFETKIAFATDRAGETDQIYTMNVDGSDAEPLFDASSHAHDRHPRWSPNGEQIAFITGRTPRPQIAVARRDGSDLEIFDESSPRGNASVSWAPGGKRVAYVGADCVSLRLLNVSTGACSVAPLKLPPPYRELHSACWESDTSLLVGALPMRDSLQMEIFRVDASTGDTTRLTDEQHVEQHCELPRVSRTGRIAVLRYLVRDGPADGIYLLHPGKAKGEKLEKLTLKVPDIQLPQAFGWFPNGEKIIFSDIDPTTRLRHIFVLHVATKICEQITSGDWNDSFPDVSPPLPAKQLSPHR